MSATIQDTQDTQQASMSGDVKHQDQEPEVLNVHLEPHSESQTKKDKQEETAEEEAAEKSKTPTQQPQQSQEQKQEQKQQQQQPQYPFPPGTILKHDDGRPAVYCPFGSAGSEEDASKTILPQIFMPYGDRKICKICFFYAGGQRKIPAEVYPSAPSAYTDKVAGQDYCKGCGALMNKCRYRGYGCSYCAEFKPAFQPPIEAPRESPTE